MTLLDRVITDRPSFHARETEISRQANPSESFVPDLISGDGPPLVWYGLDEAVLRYIGGHVGEHSRTLETGAGSSTLVFALRRARHTAVTPSQEEIARIVAYAQEHGIGLDTVSFTGEPSETFLPRCDLSDLDLVLLDGKHAFPWPYVDWFYTADRLKRGGLLLVDDAQVRSVAVLVDFLRADPGWEEVESFHGKTLVFRKERDTVLDVAWHMQPWVAGHLRAQQPGQASFLRRARRRLRRILRS